MGQVAAPLKLKTLNDSPYVNAIKLAISLGGDSDTQAAIAGGIAHAYYKHIPEDVITWAMERLPREMKKIIVAFDDVCINREGQKNDIL